MKKCVLFILALLSLVEVSAQVKINRRRAEDTSEMTRKSTKNYHGNAMVIQYGLKAGMNFSNLSNEMSFDPEFSMGQGFHLGVIGNLHWGQRTANSLPGTGLWGLQLEVLFSNQVIQSKADDIELKYIKVPVMGKIYPLSALSIELGPEFSYLMSSSPDDIALGNAIVEIGNCKGFNVGAAIGASYEFECGLLVSARYSMGFTDLAKNLKWRNNNAQISVGWLF